MIEFASHEIEFDLAKQESVKNWLLLLAHKANTEVRCLTYIFVSDEYLLSLNREHLDHDYYTDILTFPYHSEPGDPIESDIYISIDRVKENATTFKVSWLDELHRVMAHGLLHLIGYDDHKEDDVKQMRSAEAEALALRDF